MQESGKRHRQRGRARALAVVLTIVAVLGVVARFSPSAGALPDTEPPALHGGSASPTSVVGDAADPVARTMTFTATMSDNTTGLQYAYAYYQSPSGTRSLSVGFSIAAGTGIIDPIDVAGTLTVPRWSETGTWKLSNFYAGDVATNQLSLGPAAVAATGFPTSFDVTGTADLAAPLLTAGTAQLLPASPIDDQAVDPTDRTLTVSADITDDISGTSSVGVTYGNAGQYVGFGMARTAGDALAGTWSGNAVLPLYAATGTWKLTAVYLADSANNVSYLDATTAGAVGFPTTFGVTGAGDTTAPVVTAFDFTPKSFNNVGCVTTVTVSAHVTDDLAGTNYLSGYFTGPAGQTHSVSLSRANGTPVDGDWSGSFSLPFESAVGTWTLQGAYTGDTANNNRNYNTADFTTAGFPTTFDVVAGNGELCLKPDLTLQEGPGSSPLTASLTTQPQAPIDVDLTQAPGAGAAPVTQLDVAPTHLTFTPANWNVPQAVTVSAIDDGVTETAPHHATITGTATSADPIFDGQHPTADVTINELSPALQVTASPTSASGLTGFATDWSFTLANTGPGAASSPQLSVTVPTGTPGHTVTVAGTMDDGFSCAATVNAASTDYTCTRAKTPLGVGEQAHFTVSTKMVGAPGDKVGLTAVGTADATAATPASTATATATVSAPVFDLAVTNAPDVDPTTPGGSIVWTSTVTNASTDGETATNLAVNYELPAGLSLSAPPSMPGYTCSPPSGVGSVLVNCDAGPDLPPASSVTLTVPTTVTASVGTKLTTFATATANQPDSDASNNTAIPASVKVADPAKDADLQADKGVSDKAVAADGSVTWTVTATNLSKTTAADAPVIDDPLPPGLTATNVHASASFVCTVDTKSVHCTAATLPPGATATVTFDTVVPGSLGPKVTNTATASAQNDANPTNDSASAAVSVIAASIRGTVTEQGTGNPLGGISVQVVLAADTTNQVASVSTSFDGTYSVDGLSTGTYLVYFRDHSFSHAPQWYDHADALAGAMPVTISKSDDVVGKIDAALGTSTSISGTVTDQVGGAPLEGICVGAFDPGVPDFNHEPVAEAQTDSTGNYVLQGLGSTPYLVLFRDCSKTPKYAFEFYDGKAGTTSPTDALPVTPSGRGAIGIDAALGTGGSISGTAWDAATHTGLEKKCVVVFAPGFGSIAITFTDAEGRYQVGGIPAGQWYVAAGDCDKDGGTGFVWYAGATSVPASAVSDHADPMKDGAKLVTVVDGVTTTSVDLYFGSAGGSPPPTDPMISAESPSAIAPEDAVGSHALPYTGAPGPALALTGLVLVLAGAVAVRAGARRGHGVR